MIKKKLNIFKEFKFFSLKFLFIDIFWKIKEKLSIKKIRYKGKIIKLFSDTEITFLRSYFYGKKEEEVYDFIDEYLDEGETFIDIGSNVGVFSIYAALFKNANVYAFEPEYSNLFYLKKNIILNKLNKNVKIFSFGVSDKDCIFSLKLSSLESGSALHTLSNSNIKHTDEGKKVVMQEGISSLKLDSIIEQLNIRPKMIKIDTDGHELKILNGAKNTLKNENLRYIAIEMPIIENDSLSCIEILQNNGYLENQTMRKGRNYFL